MSTPQQVIPSEATIERPRNSRRVIDTKIYDLFIHDSNNSSVYLASVAPGGQIVFFFPCGYNNGNSNGSSMNPYFENMPTRETIREARELISSKCRPANYFSENGLRGKLEGDVAGIKESDYVKLEVETEKVNVMLDGVVERIWSSGLFCDLECPDYTAGKRALLTKFLESQEKKNQNS